MARHAVNANVLHCERVMTVSRASQAKVAEKRLAHSRVEIARAIRIEFVLAKPSLRTSLRKRVTRIVARTMSIEAAEAIQRVTGRAERVQSAQRGGRPGQDEDARMSIGAPRTSSTIGPGIQ